MTPANLKELKKLAKAKKITGTMRVKWGFPLAPAFPIGLAISLIFGDFVIALAAL
jgi:prepilin signal peptidase PulO-like enzyme (type II secretory pathway)